MKIIHVSDLHYGKYRQSIKTLFDTIISTYKSKEIKPLVVITGDLVDKPKRDLMNSCKKQLERLKQEGFEMLICHGNLQKAFSTIDA